MVWGFYTLTAWGEKIRSYDRGELLLLGLAKAHVLGMNGAQTSHHILGPHGAKAISNTLNDFPAASRILQRVVKDANTLSRAIPLA